MTTAIGFVEKLNSKSGQGKRGPWTAYSMKLMRDDGSVDDAWYRLGFDAPAFEEGAYIKFDYTEENGNRSVAKGSVKVSTKARTKPTSEYEANNKGSGGGGSRSGGTKSELFGDIGGYNTEDDIRRITWAGCRSNAIELVGILLENDALPMSSAKGKAGMVKRFEEIEEYVSKKTVEFYFDSATGRVIDQVADAGEVTDSTPEPVPGQDDFDEGGEAFVESDADEFEEDDDF